MRNNKELTKYVSTFLLGDSSIFIDKRDWDKGGNATFECCQIEEHADYLNWMKSVLESITSVTITPKPSHKEYRTFPNGIVSKVKPQLRLRTARHPFFNTFRERMYGTGKKAIDPHYLKLLDWESMAIWYMDDGYISNYMSKKVYPQDRLGLCTNGFTYGDNWLLKKEIKDIFDIEFNVQGCKQNGHLNYRLILRPRDVPKFIDNISKYVLPSFNYKLEQTHTGCSINKTMDEDIV
jgi:hypothetical protein